MAIPHSKSTRVYLDAYDISGKSSSMAPSAEVETADVTCLDDTARTFIPGNTNARISHNGFWEDGAAGLDAILAGYDAGARGILTYCPAGVADGAFAYSNHQAIMTSKPITSRVGEAVALNSEWQVSGGLKRLLVVYEASPTASADGSGVSFGSAGVAGSGEAVIHCTSVTGAGTIDVKLQQSSDNGDTDAWADISGGAFTQLAAIGSERITWSGAAEQYVRAVITISGFTGCTLFVAAKTGGTNA